jgi:hypothetical protein
LVEVVKVAEIVLATVAAEVMVAIVVEIMFSLVRWPQHQEVKTTSPSLLEVKTTSSITT